MNPNSLNGSVVTDHDLQTVDDQNDKEPIVKSFIEMDILRELQRELNLLDVENEFDVKVKTI